MITFLLVSLMLVLAIGLGILVWGNGRRKREGQSETTSATHASGETKVGRAAGPD